MEYFFVGLSLPNDSFWVNLRPDSPDNIIDNYLASTDVGKIMLETDLQLKRDTAKATSPETPEGREYWNKLYQKAGEIFGAENVSIPTLTRPWIVPGEIIICETTDSAYIYKATLKVMLEEEYLKSPVSMSPSHQNNAVGTGRDLSVNYEFKDQRLKELNTYSTQLIKELIIPKLNKEINSAKRYASLRQVYYSLIFAQWFKARYANKDTPYSRLINRRDLTNLCSNELWSKSFYFREYQKSFKDGEYNIQQPISTPYGQTIRSYFSGGEIFDLGRMTQLGQAAVNPTTGSTISSIPTAVSSLVNTDIVVSVKVDTTENPGELNRIQIIENTATSTTFARVADINLAASSNQRVPHIGVNSYIRDNLPQDLRSDAGNINNYKLINGYEAQARVVPIAGLFQATGQFAHIGLGQVYGQAVVYIDSMLAGQEEKDVLNHELFEIGKWESLRKNFGKQPHQMRQWIQDNYEFAKEQAEVYHLLAPSIEYLFAKYQFQANQDSFEMFAVYEDERDINLAAGWWSKRSKEGHGQRSKNLQVTQTDSDTVKELTIYGGTSSEDWKQAILKENRWHEGVNFRRLLGTNRVLVLGDTNHGLLGIQRALVEHLRELKEAGVTHLGLEIESDLKVADVDKIAQRVWIPHRFKQLVKLAEQIGLKIKFIDLPKSQIQASWSNNQTDFERGVYMGKYISQFLRDNPEAVMTVVTGYAHIQDYNQIPAQLDINSFSYSLIPLVSEDQVFNLLGLESNFFLLSVVQAIREIVEPNKNYGYIDLVGLPFETRGATAILHFPRPKVTAHTARSLETGETLENGITALGVRTNFTQLAPVAENAITKPIHLDFQDKVDGNVHFWDTTNQYRIIEWVKNLQGISSGQKFYLAALLINYANNTGSHSLSGSIIDIGFIPDGQYFEITTVDTCGYPYDPNRDYGSLKRHWEVSLKTLQERFGFEDILIKDLSEVPEIRIRNNPDRPLSIIKLLLLVLTVNKHPERVAIRSGMLSLGVFTGEPGKSVMIARLELEDFMLTDLEQAFMEIAEVINKINLPLMSLRAIFYDTLMPAQVRVLKRRRVEAIRDSLLEAEKVASVWIEFATKEEIFKARKKLSVLSDEQAVYLLAKLDEAISKTEETLRLVEEYASENRSFFQARDSNRYPGPSAGTNLAQAKHLLFKLRAARSRISAYPALTSSVRSALTESAKVTSVSEANLIESAIPPQQEGVERYRYFTGKIDRETMWFLLREGIYLKDFGRDERVWNISKSDFDEYMFHERDGELGYVIFVDIPESIVSQVRTMDGKFLDNVRSLISEGGNSRDSNYTADTPKLRTEFIIGAIDQRTGEWFSSTQEKEEPPTNNGPKINLDTNSQNIAGKDEMGGIDFQNLPIITQAVSNLSMGINSISLIRLNAINLNSEWREIENLVNSEIIPSAERIKEYVQASCYKGSIDMDIDKVISCISDILRVEEERCSSTEPMLRDILVLLQSGMPLQEVKAVFAGH